MNDKIKKTQIFLQNEVLFQSSLKITQGVVKFLKSSFYEKYYLYIA